MTFYLKPPRGEIALANLTDLGLKRLSFLGLLERCRGDAQELSEALESRGDLSEAVAEDTPKDRVSHFMLGLAATRDSSFRSFFLRNEARLFLLRCQTLSSEQRESALKDLQRHLRELLKASRRDCDLVPIFDAVSEVIETDLISGSGEVLVPFEIVASLVSERKVELRAGSAVITSKEEVLLPFLAALFSHLLRDHSRRLSREAEADERLTDFASEVLAEFRLEHASEDERWQWGKSSRRLRAIDVSKEGAGR